MDKNEKSDRSFSANSETDRKLFGYPDLDFET